MQKQSLKSIKAMKPVILSEEQLKVLKGGDPNPAGSSGSGQAGSSAADEPDR